MVENDGAVLDYTGLQEVDFEVDRIKAIVLTWIM